MAAVESVLLLEIGNRDGIASQGSERLAPPDICSNAASRQPYRLLMRHLCYAVALLLAATTALTLYGIAAQAFKANTGPTDWVEFVCESALNWLVSLAPVAILMVLVKD